MCGFIVSLSNESEDKYKIEESLELISHRGPNNKKTLSFNNINFGFARLSIQDLSNSAMQPMFSQNNRFIIVFNGEIYNYKLIRDNLKINQKKSFRTNSDTEVLLECISVYGLEKTLQKIKGMFAFVIFDKFQNKLILCRDHFGQKNLYFTIDKTKDGGRLIIASEIKAFLPFKKCFEPDKDKITPLLFLDRPPTSGSIFKDVNEVKPGSFFALSPDDFLNIKEVEYFHPSELVNENLYRHNKSLSKKDLVEEFDYLMQRSIDMHSISDAKLGLLFSAGVDSHLLLSYLDKYNVELFYASSKKQIGDNLAEKIALDHNCRINKKDIDKENSLLIDLPKLLWSYEQPNQLEGLMLAKVCNLAKERGFKVLISGCCADELFGGYPYYNHFSWDIKSTRLFKNKRFIRKIFNILGDLFLTPNSLPFHNFLYPTSLKRLFEFIDFEISKSNVHKEYERASRAYYFLDDDEEILNNAYLLEELSTRMLRFLHRNDRFSMQESIELRVPYLDKDLVKFALNIPAYRRSSAPSLNYSRCSKPLIRKLLNKRTGKKYPVRMQAKQGPIFNFHNDLKYISKNFSYKNLESIFNLPANSILKLIEEDKFNSFKLRYNLISTEILLSQFCNNQNRNDIEDNLRFLINKKNV